MGIPKFFNYIKTNYCESETLPKCIDSFKYLPKTNKYDFLLLDFQSLIYGSYGIFCSEFNFLLRLIAYCHINAHNEINVLTEKINKPNTRQQSASDNITIGDVVTNYINKYNDWIILFTTKYPTQFAQLNLLKKFNKLTTINEIKKYTEIFLTIDFKDQSLIIGYLSDIVVELTKNLAKTQIKGKKCFSKTYIYFDGIPSIAKIKEQIGRRIFGSVITDVKDDISSKIQSIVTNIPSTSLIKSISDIESKLLQSYPPSIGVGTPVILMLRTKLSAINESSNGKFIINSAENYGEAEHQLMKFVYLNKSIFQNKQILLASPDADLILLTLIASCNDLFINILRVTSVVETIYTFVPGFKVNSKNQFLSPFYSEYIFIDISILKTNLALTNRQKMFDICFSLLLLGDDFIPIIPTLSIDIMKNIIDSYDKLCIQNPEFKIIDSNTSSASTSGGQFIIKPLNLLILLKEIIGYKTTLVITPTTLPAQSNTLPAQSNTPAQSNPPLTKIEANFENGIIEKHNKNLKNGPKNIKKSLDGLLNLYKYNAKIGETNAYGDLEKYQKGYYVENGFVTDDSIQGQLKTLIQPRSKVTLTYSDDKITNYLQGYQFILDIYFNNTLKNYKWHYAHSESPTLTEIITFMSKKTEAELSAIFDYTNGGRNITSVDLQYLNVESYGAYSNENKDKIIKDAIKRINKDEQFIEPLSELKKRYFTVSNIDKIINCNNKQYFNKCIEVEELVPDQEYTNKPVKKEQLGGYYNKYLKYKYKYIMLKKSIKQIN